MLTGLLIPAIGMVRIKTKRVVIASEIHQLDLALSSFKEKYGEYPPDFANPDREAALREVQRFIMKAWPRCQQLPRDFDSNYTTELPNYYNAGTSLLFWLGGVYTNDDGWTGFSADSLNPFDVDADGRYRLSGGATTTVTGKNREPTFFKLSFDSMRTVKVAAGTAFQNADATLPAIASDPNLVLFSFWPDGINDDPENSLTGYVYFRADARRYGYYVTSGGVTTLDHFKSYWTCKELLPAASSADVLAFAAANPRNPAYDAKLSTPASNKFHWFNSESFQIRCCGLDGKLFGEPSSGTLSWWSAIGEQCIGPPSNGAFFVENKDDMANCWDGTIDEAIKVE
jgi:hypothetical protein